MCVSVWSGLVDERLDFVFAWRLHICEPELHLRRFYLSVLCIWEFFSSLVRGVFCCLLDKVDTTVVVLLSTNTPFDLIESPLV